jgi:hypothetical protein
VHPRMAWTQSRFASPRAEARAERAAIHADARAREMHMQASMHETELRRLDPGRATLMQVSRGRRPDSATAPTTGRAHRTRRTMPTKAKSSAVRKQVAAARNAANTTEESASPTVSQEENGQKVAVPASDSSSSDATTTIDDKWWRCTSAAPVRAGIELSSQRLGVLPAGSRVQVIARGRSTCGKLRLQIQTDAVPTSTREADAATGANDQADHASVASRTQWISELTRLGRFVAPPRVGSTTKGRDRTKPDSNSRQKKRPAGKQR